MPTKKAAKKKSASKKKAASKRKASSSSKKKASSKKKVATKKVATKRKSNGKAKASTRKASTVRKATSTSTKAKASTRAKASTKKATKNVASKRVAKPRVKKALAPQEARVIQGTPSTCYKVVAERQVGKGKRAKTVLTSVYARDPLRVIYSDKDFAQSPHKRLPLVAFSSLQMAERFCNRNRRHQRSNWLIVEGLGVRTNHASRRVKSIVKTEASMASASLEQLANSINSTMRNGRRRDGVTTPWSRGSVFLHNFRITRVIAQLAYQK